MCLRIVFPACISSACLTPCPPRHRNQLNWTQVRQIGYFCTCWGGLWLPCHKKGGTGGWGATALGAFICLLWVHQGYSDFWWESHARITLDRTYNVTEVENVSFPFPSPGDTAKEGSHWPWDSASCHFLTSSHRWPEFKRRLLRLQEGDWKLESVFGLVVKMRRKEKHWFFCPWPL